MSDCVIHTKNGRLAEDTPFETVKQLVENGVENGHIVLHIHGGLVNEANGRTTAARLKPVYEAAGTSPIFVVWETGLIETLENNLISVAKEVFFRLVLKRVLGIVLRKFAQEDGARAASTVPLVDLYGREDALDRALDLGDLSMMPVDPVTPGGLTEITDAERLTLERELEMDPVLGRATTGVSASLRAEEDIHSDLVSRSAEAPVLASTETLMDPEAMEDLLERDSPGTRGVVTIGKIARAVVKISARVIKRHLQGRDHGLHATVVEELLHALYVGNIGGFIWKTMKQDTADHFKDDPMIHGGTAILKVLADRLRAGDNPQVSLVGHSTGAVFIAHFLEAASTRLPVGFQFNLVLLAPASTFQLSSDLILGNRERIAGMRMFAMTDENEKKDRLVPVLYPHSLLYFVSGVVEKETDMPIIGMQRFYDPNQYGDAEYPQTKVFRDHLEEVPDTAVWSVSTGPAGRGSAALKHQDFDEEDRTMASVKHILQQGYEA